MSADSTARALIFDFDGLLCDTEVAVFETWRSLYADHGHALTVDTWLQAIGHVANFDPRQHLDTLTGRPLDWDTLNLRINEENWQRVSELPSLPGARELMQAGRDAGYRIGVASNSTDNWVSRGLTRVGLDDLVEAVCTRESVTKFKPAPDIYLQTLAQLECTADQSIAFEDSGPGVESAKAAGLTVVAVPNSLTKHHDLSAADIQVASLADYALPETS